MYDKCGGSQVVGTVTLDNFVWAADLGQDSVASGCEPPPATNFPEAQCVIVRCEDY